MDQDVVDQAGAADPGGDRDQHRAAVQLGDRRKVVGIARLQVLGLDPRRRQLARARPRSPAASDSARARALDRAQRPRERRRPLALRRVEVGVARAHRQPVGLAHDRQRLDPHRDVEVAGHAPDHRQPAGRPSGRSRRRRADVLKSLATTVVTPRKCSGPRRAGSPQRTSVRPLDLDRRWRSLPGRPPRPAARRPGRRRPRRRAGVALLVARVAVEVLAGPNWVGLTKRLMTTTSHSARAARSSERWPSCR